MPEWAACREIKETTVMKLFSRAEGPGRRRSLVGRLALSVGLLLPVAASFGVFAAVFSSAPASASIPASEATGDVYVPVTPVRVADTRANSGFQGAGDTLSSGQILTIRVAGLPSDGVPSNAVAVVLNITAVDPSTAGYLTAYAAGQTTPFASTVNFIAGQTIANEATITLGNNGVTSGYVSILNHVGLTDVVVDVQGFYLDAPALPVGVYFPVSYPNPVTGTLDNAPIRVLDTRQNSGQQDAGQTLGPDQQLTFYPGTSTFAPSLTLVPANAIAVVLNLTEADSTASSFLTAWATGVAQPLASDVNFLAGQTIANRVIVPYNSATQTISVYNWAGSTDVVADLDGYFADPPLGVEPTLCPVTTAAANQTTLSFTATGGTFTLNYNGNTTGTIPYNASAAAVLSDLQAAPTYFPTTGVSATGGPLGTAPVVITYASGALTITGNLAGLTGGTNTVTTVALPAVYPSTCPGFYIGSYYYGLTAPARIADTRANSGEPYTLSTLGALSILDIDVPGDVWGPATGYNAPANFDGVDVNVTVTNTTGSSFLTIFPAQGGIGLAQLTTYPTSDINWVPGWIISNGDIVTTVASFPFTSMDVFNWSGNVDVVVDVYGYFAPI
jgi:hypothetical protein